MMKTKKPGATARPAWRRPDGMRSLSQTPRMVPAGRVVVHSHVRPRRDMVNCTVGYQGFRAWTQFPNKKTLERCNCGWAPQLGTHYRVKRSK